VLDPATEDVIRAVGDGDDCRLALNAAAAALPSWSRKTAYERAMRERNDDLARTRIEAR
jgi:acyl-CoA reductase-like NAD-dependent aldehyde dehydrogenase